MNTPEKDERLGKWSASSALRIHKCPASVGFVGNLPEAQRIKSSGDVTASGTRIHEGWENGEDEGLDMTESQILTAIKEMEGKALSEWIKSLPAIGEVTEYREERFWILDEATLEPITSAQVDVAYVCGKSALIIDGKTGYKSVTPANINRQMMVQAVSLFMDSGVENIRVAIAAHRWKSVLTQADYNLEALQKAHASIIFDDWRTKQSDAEFSAGTWCEYCPGRGACKHFAVYSMLPSVMAQVSKTKRGAIVASADHLTLEDLAFVERRRGLGEKFYDAVKSRLKLMTAEDLASIGFELKPGNWKSEFKDPGAIMDMLEDMELIKEGEIMEFFDYVNGRMEEKVITRLVLKQKAEGKTITQEDAKELLRSMLTSAGLANYQASRQDGQLKEMKP